MHVYGLWERPIVILCLASSVVMPMWMIKMLQSMLLKFAATTIVNFLCMYLLSSKFFSKEIQEVNKSFIIRNYLTSVFIKLIKEV